VFTGWWKTLRFPVNRPLTDGEKGAALPIWSTIVDNYDSRGSLVALNSTYIEWIDRRFLLRGSINTCVALIGCVFVFIASTYFLLYWGIITPDFDAQLVAFFGYAIILFLVVVMYCAQPGYDLFKKIYYPIRFNRKNGMIYVYRDKKDGGILSVPWNKVFFHVGEGLKNKNLCDIRGEILDGKIVKDTFALGHYFEQPEPVHQMWNFICNYMEGGPKAVEQDPLDRYITLSVSPSFRNCLMMAYGFYGATNAAVRIISLPFIALTTITRWLVFKTCSMPVWPAEIEAACKIEPDDPDVWPTPKYTGQFAAENPALVRRAMEKNRALSGSPSLADQFDNWQSPIRKD
jgi:hypothetical protein